MFDLFIVVKIVPSSVCIFHLIIVSESDELNDPDLHRIMKIALQTVNRYPACILLKAGPRSEIDLNKYSNSYGSVPFGSQIGFNHLSRFTQGIQ